VVFLNVAVINIVTAIAGYITLEVVKREPFSTDAFIIMSVYTLLLNLFFASLGLFMSTLVKRARPITTLSIGLVLILYFIFTISNITEGFSVIGYATRTNLSVWTRWPRITGSSSSLYSILCGLSLLLTFIALRLYRRKEIYL
jgi:ABC-2 type transport system permease protein